jgi:hypothetical protein
MSEKTISRYCPFNKGTKNRLKKVVLIIKQYLDKYLVVCHSVGLTRHIVENGGKLPQELG